METAVYKVEKDNINRVRYLNVMNSWQKDKDYHIDKDAMIYAISFKEMVQACAYVSLTEDMAKITMFNNSINHIDQIEKDAKDQLTQLIENEYGITDKVFQHIKVK